jgi:hypothetical protein
MLLHDFPLGRRYIFTAQSLGDFKGDAVNDYVVHEQDSTSTSQGSQVYSSPDFALVRHGYRVSADRRTAARFALALSAEVPMTLTPARYRELADKLERNALSVRASIGESRMHNNPQHYKVCAEPEHPGCHERALVADALEAVSALRALAEEGEKEQEPLRCMDCGTKYRDFPLDTTLPNEQWRMIHGDESGVLCACCIVARAARLTGAVAVRARIEFTSEGAESIRAQLSPEEATALVRGLEDVKAGRITPLSDLDVRGTDGCKVTTETKR